MFRGPDMTVYNEILELQTSPARCKFSQVTRFRFQGEGQVEVVFLKVIWSGG